MDASERAEAEAEANEAANVGNEGRRELEEPSLELRQPSAEQAAAPEAAALAASPPKSRSQWRTTESHAVPANEGASQSPVKSVGTELRKLLASGPGPDGRQEVEGQGEDASPRRLE